MGPSDDGTGNAESMGGGGRFGMNSDNTRQPRLQLHRIAFIKGEGTRAGAEGRAGRVVCHYLRRARLFITWLIRFLYFV